MTQKTTRKAFREEFHRTGESTIKPKALHQKSASSTESWWVNQSRQSFNQRADEELTRMRSSSIGSAQWQTFREDAR